MSANMTSNTPSGILAYCEYLISKGYASAAQINPWRTAIQKVFQTVEGDAWEELDLSQVDLDQYAARFQTLAGPQYKAESIASYKRRVGNALDAHAHYLEHGRPPAFKQRGSRAEKSAKAAPSKKSDLAVVEGQGEGPSASTTTPAAAPVLPQTPGMVDYPFPLDNGQFATLKLPAKLTGGEVNRLTMFLRSLQVESPQEPAQLPASSTARA
jgi:hypothetical protein